MTTPTGYLVRPADIRQLAYLASGEAWLWDELARYTYRPGWVLTVEWSGLVFDPPTLVVRYTAPDSNDPARDLSLVFRSVIPPEVTECRNSGDFGGWLAHMLRLVEEHELREWLRRDGVRVSDPHTDGCGRRTVG
jgi:hypothetical protein